MIGQNKRENDFHWLFTTVVYQQIENSERANQIHRFTIDHCKFILNRFRTTFHLFKEAKLIPCRHVGKYAVENFTPKVPSLVTPYILTFLKKLAFLLATVARAF